MSVSRIFCRSSGITKIALTRVVKNSAARPARATARSRVVSGPKVTYSANRTAATTAAVSQTDLLLSIGNPLRRRGTIGRARAENGAGAVYRDRSPESLRLGRPRPHLVAY